MTVIGKRALRLGVIALCAMSSPLGAVAQTPSATVTQAPAQQSGATPPATVVMPEGDVILILIRTTLLTLNDAVRTGNFTVLRDVAAPAFRDRNSAGRLAQIFDDLGKRGINLTAVAVLAPQLSDPPALDQAAGMLRLNGIFPGKPVQINFDLTFQAISGRWQLFAITVNPSASETTTNAPAAAPQTLPQAAKADPVKKAAQPVAKPGPAEKAVPNGSQK